MQVFNNFNEVVEAHAVPEHAGGVWDSTTINMSPVGATKFPKEMQGTHYTFSLVKNPQGRGVDLVATNVNDPSELSFVVGGSPFPDRDKALEYINQRRAGTVWGANVPGLIKLENRQGNIPYE